MTNITKKIMRRVYVIWGVRYVLPRLAVSIGLFWVAFRVTAQSFFVSKIFINFISVAFSSVWAVPQFITSALNSAQPQVLVLISATGISGFFLAVKLLRSIRSIVANGSLAAVLSKTK
ncbi:MAG TPA: hypothetical protein VJH05_02465 [Candidatus Paceibacterota bacterium]